MICFDVHKQAPILSDLKVDTVLYSIAWVDARGSRWLVGLARLLFSPERQQFPREAFPQVYYDIGTGPSAIQYVPEIAQHVILLSKKKLQDRNAKERQESQKVDPVS